MDIDFGNISIPAQICGLIVIIICLIAPQCKERKHIIALHSTANVFCIIQFIILGAFAGMGGAIIALTRGFTFLAVEKKFSKIPLWVLIVFIVAQVVVVWVTWDGLVTLLLLIPITYTYGQWQKNVKVTRLMLLFTVLSLGIYCTLIGAYTGAVNEFIQVGSLLLAFFRFRKINKEGESNE